MTLETVIVVAGCAQLALLVAIVQVPWTLRWRTELQPLPRVHRQMHWVYGGYMTMSIAALAILSIVSAPELSSGSRLARGVCAYAALFWCVRLVCQGVFDMEPYLTRPWMKAGYAALTLMFASLTAVYAWAAVRGQGVL